MEHLDSWKSESVFKKQLELNKKELNGNYPPHWYSFIKLINLLDENLSILDIGCGVGSYSELCRIHLPNVSYTGIDYSEDAIKIAKREWSQKYKFITKNIYDLDKYFLSDYNLIHLGAVLDILPNADEILELILKFSVKYVIISRIDISNSSECYTYQAYDEITTYKYVHSYTQLLKIFHNNNYDILGVDGNNLLLKKNMIK